MSYKDFNEKQTFNDDVNFGDNALSGVGRIDFDVNSTEGNGEGSVIWNHSNRTLDIHTGLGPVLQVGKEHQSMAYNGTQEIIPNGTPVRPVGVIDGINGIAVSVAPARSDTFEGFAIGVGVTTMDIPLSGDGIGITSDFGNIRDVDTTIWPTFSTLWVNPSGGMPVAEKPEFPNYAVQIGATAQPGVSGTIGLNIKAEANDTFDNAFNGSFRETIDFNVDSDGTNVSGFLTPANGNVDMTMMFSDGFSLLDTDPFAYVSLTPGTDTNPQMNYIYVTANNKVLEVSTSSWPAPTVEHIKVASVYLRSASATQTDDALKNHNWNDHIQGTNGNGHILHIAEAVRRKIGATWLDGTAGTCSVSGTPSDVLVSTTGGTVMQLHEQTWLPLSNTTGDSCHIVNHATTPFVESLNLNDQTNDALGVTLANSSFSFVLWGVQNKSGETSHMMINLPVASYAKNNPQGAVSDSNNYSVYDIPVEFQGVGFLIARFTFVLEAGGTAWTLFDTENLRGRIPNATAGGGGGGTGVLEFTALTDTPATYTGFEEYFLKVNPAGNAVEFIVKDTTDIDSLSSVIDTNSDNITVNSTNIDSLSSAIDTNTDNILWELSASTAITPKDSSKEMILPSLSGIGDGTIITTDIDGTLEVSNNTITDGPIGGSVLSMTPFVTDPVSGDLEQHDTWLVQDGTNILFKYWNGTDKFSVELTKE